jgi:hypothetical protein
MIDDPVKQAVIDRIRQLRAEGNGLRKIAKYLEEAGIPCRVDHWHGSSIASILGRNGLSVSFSRFPSMSNSCFCTLPCSSVPDLC